MFKREKFPHETSKLLSFAYKLGELETEIGRYARGLSAAHRIQVIEALSLLDLPRFKLEVVASKLIEDEVARRERTTTPTTARLDARGQHRTPEPIVPLLPIRSKATT